jgi:two-component system response regulator AtoC
VVAAPAASVEPAFTGVGPARAEAAEEAVPAVAMAGAINGIDVESADGVNLQMLARTAAMRAEREAIEQALVRFRWNRRKTAEYLSVSYKTLLNKIKECGITDSGAL